MDTFTKNNPIIQEQVQFLIERLQSAIEVTNTAPDNPDEGYAFATGYARSAMEGTLVALQELAQGA